MKIQTATYQAPKIIDLTKNENFMEELSRFLNLKERFYYVNVFEGRHSLMQIEVTNGVPTKIIDFSGRRAPFIMSYLDKSMKSNTAILEVEVKGAII